MKKLLFAACLVFAACTCAQAQTFYQKDVRTRGPMSVGKGSDPVAPNAGTWLDIGKDTSHKSGILLHYGDTSKVPKVRGAIMYQYKPGADSSFYGYNGKAWMKLN